MIPSKSQNCLEVIDPQNDEVIGAVKKTTYPIYILVSWQLLGCVMVVCCLDTNTWNG